VNEDYGHRVAVGQPGLDFWPPPPDAVAERCRSAGTGNADGCLLWGRMCPGGSTLAGSHRARIVGSLGWHEERKGGLTILLRGGWS
jgi:hypothetical protein